MEGREDHSMTNIEDGGADAAENTTTQKTNNAQPQPSNHQDVDGGTTDQEVPGDAGTDEGAIPGEGEGAEADALVDENGNPIEGDGGEMQLTPDAINEMIAKGVKDAMANNAPPPPVELTDEQWAEKEQEVGVSRNTIKFFTNQSMKVYNAVAQMMDARMAKFERQDTMRSLARTKGYEDALRYPKGVEQFLSRYKPEHHSNPELLKMAVVYARGLASKGNVQRARVESERNRRVAGVSRPASPGSTGRRPGTTIQRPLTPMQRQAAAMMPGGEAEYRKHMSQRNQPIADGAPTR